MYLRLDQIAALKQLFEIQHDSINITVLKFRFFKWRL